MNTQVEAAGLAGEPDFRALNSKTEADLKEAHQDAACVWLTTQQTHSIPICTLTENKDRTPPFLANPKSREDDSTQGRKQQEIRQ
jgi:hypothetical protein